MREEAAEAGAEVDGRELHRVSAVVAGDLDGVEGMTDQQIVREYDPQLGRWVTRHQAEATPGSTPNLDGVLAVGSDAGDQVITNLGGIEGLGSGAGGYSIVGASGLYLAGSDPTVEPVSNGNGAFVEVPAGAGPASGAAVQSGYGPADTAGGTTQINGGDGHNYATSGAYAWFKGGGAAPGQHGHVELKTGNARGVGGQALVSDGNNQLVYGGVQTAAGAPSGAPVGFLPLHIDTGTGDLYVWNGTTWNGPYAETP